MDRSIDQCLSRPPSPCKRPSLRRLKTKSPRDSTSVSVRESLPPSLPLRECLCNDLPPSLPPRKCCLRRRRCRRPRGAVSVRIEQCDGREEAAKASSSESLELRKPVCIRIRTKYVYGMRVRTHPAPAYVHRTCARTWRPTCIRTVVLGLNYTEYGATLHIKPAYIRIRIHKNTVAPECCSIRVRFSRLWSRIPLR